MLSYTIRRILATIPVMVVVALSGAVLGFQENYAATKLSALARTKLVSPPFLHRNTVNKRVHSRSTAIVNI